MTVPILVYPWYNLPRDLAQNPTEYVGILSTIGFPFNASSTGGGQFALDKFMKEILKKNILSFKILSSKDFSYFRTVRNRLKMFWKHVIGSFMS